MVMMSKESVGLPSLIDNQPIKQGEMDDGMMIMIAIGFCAFTMFCFAICSRD
jgi:hypothetical protein